MMSKAVVEFQQNVSRETLEKLERFVALVQKWTPAVNLVSRNSLPDIWTRHVLDSAQLFPYRSQSPSHWVDLGSGGGFPGIVIAVLASEANPEMALSLVESDQRKAAFLREACRHLELDSKILCDRIESIPHLGADIVSARALAPLISLCDMASRHLKPHGVALFMKGRGYAAEVDAAKADWGFECRITQSKTDPEAAILRLSSIRKAQ